MSEFFNFVKSQWHDIKGNAKWDFIKLGALAMIATPAAIIHFIGHAPLWEVLVVLVVSTLCVAVLFCVILWAIKKWWSPKTEKEKLKEMVDEIAKRNFPERFEPVHDLEITFVPNNPKAAKKHPCQIKIRNKNSAKNADDLKVEIVAFTSELSAEQAMYYHPEFPYFLKLDSKNKTINPLDSIIIAGFDFESSSKIEGVEQKFVAGFDLEKSTEKKYALFHEKKNYPIKFAASARGMARVEKEFNMIFSVENGIGCINLNPISEDEKTTKIPKDDRAVRKKIKDSLASCRMTIQNLCGQLDGIQYFKYYDETRQNFERDYLDFENSTYKFLHDKVGRSEAISFIDDQRIPKVVAPPDSHFDLPAFKERWIAHKFMLNRLKFREEQIEKAETKLDSKDFVLPHEISNALIGEN